MIQDYQGYRAKPAHEWYVELDENYEQIGEPFSPVANHFDEGTLVVLWVEPLVPASSQVVLDDRTILQVVANYAPISRKDFGTPKDTLHRKVSESYAGKYKSAADAALFDLSVSEYQKQIIYRWVDRVIEDTAGLAYYLVGVMDSDDPERVEPNA